MPPATTFDLETGQGDAYICYSWSANVVEVEVDTETGETRVVEVWSGHDAGRVVNPTTGEGQVEGGVLQGLGYALVEEHAMRDGRILNDQFSTYIIPTTPRHAGDQGHPGGARVPVGAVRRQGAGRDADHRGRARGDRGHPPRHRRAPRPRSRPRPERVWAALRARSGQRG